MECDTVGDDTQVTHIGTARFTAMDKNGELRTFDVPDCHVIPSCQKILIGNEAESSGTYYVQPENDEWYLLIPYGAHLPVTRTANDLVGLVCIPNAMGAKAARNLKLAALFNERGLQVQRQDTCAEYFGGIGAATLALNGLYETVAYFDNNIIAAETYNLHSPQVDQYGSMSAVLKDSTCKGSFVQQARTAEIAFCAPPCTQITHVNPHRDERSATARLFVIFLDVIDRTRHSMCFVESPAAVMTADGGRLFASFQDKCSHVGYVVHTIGMNARMYGSIENIHRICSSAWMVRSDIHDRLGPMRPPMPTVTSPSDMRTMREALLPAGSPLVTALIDS
jgi:hypothetical protein